MSNVLSHTIHKINSTSLQMHKTDTNIYIVPMLIRIIYFISIYLIGFYLTYHQVYTITPNAISINITNYASDTQQHIEFIREFIAGEKYIPHPLWHILVKTYSIFFHITLEYASVLVSSSILLFWVYLLYMTVNIFLKDSFTNLNYISRELLVLLIVTSIYTIGPLVYTPYSNLIYKGVGSPNIWHNVTLWMVKPFALLSILFSIWAIQKEKLSYYLYTLIAIIFSIFAKPSFIMVFLPSIIILILTRYYIKRKNIYFLFLIISISISILLYQYLNTYTSSHSGGIVIDILGVWRNFGINNIPLSIFLALGFPILFYAIYPNSFKNDFLILAWLQTIFGIILYALFAEKGAHYSHGNFGWSYRIAMSILYIFSIIEFIKVFFLLEIKRRIFLLIILFIQIWIGIYYLVHILMGQNPLYISFYWS